MHLIPLITCRVKNSLADNQDSLDDYLTSLWILSSFGLLYPMEMLSFHYGRKRAHISQDWASAALLNESSVSMRGHAQRHMSQRTRPHIRDTPTLGTRPHREHMSQRTRPQAKDTPTPGTRPHRGMPPHRGHTPTEDTPTQRAHVQEVTPPSRGHAPTRDTPTPRGHTV